MKPFWEEEYLNKEKSVFGEPSKEIIDIVPLLDKDARILDIGCGDGRNSLYLAKHGFHVDAFDISENAIEKLNYICKRDNISINACVSDILDYEFRYEYDLIILHGVLQFIDRNMQPKVLDLVKRWTKSGGYNIIALFTDAEPVPEDLKGIMVGPFHEGEIKNYYEDWTVTMFQSKRFQDEHENGIKHKHAMNKLVAKKEK